MKLKDDYLELFQEFLQDALNEPDVLGVGTVVISFKFATHTPQRSIFEVKVRDAKGYVSTIGYEFDRISQEIIWCLINNVPFSLEDKYAYRDEGSK